MELVVGNRRHFYWSNFSITLNFNAIASSFSFNFYYDEDKRLNKDVALPLTYKNCVLTDNGETLLTGVILNHGFSSQPEKKLSSISGYSKTGILADVCVPVDMYPIQYDDLSLLEIATKLCDKFGISIVVDEAVSSEMNEPIEEIELEPTDKIGDFLSKTASEKNIVLTHTDSGELLFTRANTDQASVFDFGNDAICISKKLSVDGQGMHSQITAMGDSEDEPSNASEDTIENPYVKIFRPKVVSQDLGDDLTTAKVARTALGEELRAIKLSLSVRSWYDKNGDNWRPNKIITVVDKEINILNKTKFFIESVSFSGDPEKQVANLECVLPEVYNDKEIIPIF